MTKVSIILPTYNGAKYIKRAIDSVLSQTFSDWELLVIDDGSTDNTEELIKEHANKDNRIIYLKQENQGQGIARKNGIDNSKGEYVAFIDDDDIWIDKNKLNAQVIFLDNNNDYVMVGTNGLNIDENNEIIKVFSHPMSDEEIRKIILIKNHFINSSVVARKLILEKADISFFNKRYAEDYNLWLLMGTLGKFGNLSDSMVSYTTRKGNISSGNKIFQIKTVISLVWKFKNNYPNFYKGFLLNFFKLIVFSFIIKFNLNNNSFVFKIKELFKKIFLD